MSNYNLKINTETDVIGHCAERVCYFLSRSFMYFFCVHIGYVVTFSLYTTTLLFTHHYIEGIL